jgi:hypothetical protein
LRPGDRGNYFHKGHIDHKKDGFAEKRKYSPKAIGLAARRQKSQPHGLKPTNCNTVDYRSDKKQPKRFKEDGYTSRLIVQTLRE